MKTDEKKSSVNIEYLGDHPEAIPVVAQWIYDEWHFLYPGKTVRFIESLLRKRTNRNRLPLTLVAFAKGHPVGTVSLKAYDMASRRSLTPWVTSLYVAEAWRGKGIGSSLMKAIERKALDLGIRRLFLLTADEGLAARFYARSGWKEKERPSYRSYTVIIMEKELKEQSRLDAA